MKTESYEELPGFGKTGQILRHFGEQQNEINAQLNEQMELLAKQLGDAMQRIADLEAAQKESNAALSRCTQEMDAMQKEIDRLRLTAKLNSNTLERLTKG